jgi:hypothetical protein
MAAWPRKGAKGHKTAWPRKGEKKTAWPRKGAKGHKTKAHHVFVLGALGPRESRAFFKRSDE